MTDPQHPANPARWAPDPTGRHQYRYWNGTTWSDQVSDNGMVTTDPPVASPAPTVTPQAVPGVPPPPGGGAATPYAAAPYAATSYPGAPYAATPYPGTPVAAPAGAGWPYQRDPTSVLGRRYGAFFIDLAVCLFVLGLAFTAFATQRTEAETLRLPGCHLSTRNSNSFSDSSSANVECDNRAIVQIGDTVYEANGGATLGLFLLFTLLYFALPEAFAGVTLGKLATGIRVVGEDGEKIGLGRSLVRWIAFFVDGPLSLFLCGIITSASSRGHRRLGDMGAKSYVVARSDAGDLVVLPPR